MKTSIVKYIAIGFFGVLTASCELLVLDPHDNFLSSYTSDIGRSIHDNRANPVRYSEEILGESILANGNKEIEFQHNLKCSVFYEIDSRSQTFIGYRFEGSKEDCVLYP